VYAGPAAHMGSEGTETGTTGEEITEMSTETTSDLFRRAADAWVGDTASDDDVRRELRARADRLEREQPPLPTKAGFYELIVVERGGEKCTGALLRTDTWWVTEQAVAGTYTHVVGDPRTTIRWAEQDGPTPGQTLREAASAEGQEWPTDDPFVKDQIERITAAVLAAYAAPTLTPVGEHPEPGTRGLLPVVLVTEGDGEGFWREGIWRSAGTERFVGYPGPDGREVILADPRPDGAL